MTTTDKRNNAVGPQVRAKKVKSGKLNYPATGLAIANGRFDCGLAILRQCLSISSRTWTPLL